MLFVFFNLTGKKDALSAGDNHLRSSLKSFSSSERKNKTELGWTTASEINNDHFLLERSADGMNYVLLGKVKGAGNSVHDMNYAFIDESPLNGNNYYRLTQVNFDGKSASYSPVVVKFNRQMEGD